MTNLIFKKARSAVFSLMCNNSSSGKAYIRFDVLQRYETGLPCYAIDITDILTMDTLLRAINRSFHWRRRG